MKISPKGSKPYAFRFLPVLALVTLLTACGQSDSNPFASESVNRDEIKSLMIANYLSQFNIEEEAPDFIPESSSNATVNHQPVAQATSDKSDEFVRAWRAKVADPWLEFKDSDLDKICEFFYEGLSDPENSFAKFMSNAKSQFEAGGIVIHSINKIRMAEDNRQTIKYPTAEFSSSLFVCQADIVFKKLNGTFTAVQDSSLAWNYYIKGDETPFAFTFKSFKK
jgi:hypothetical protein